MALSRFEIRQELKKLNRLDSERADYASICATYSRITDGLRLVIGMAGGGELFFRIRRTGGAKPHDVASLLAPPAERVIGYQRCNPPGIPMFYASSRRIGALIEARVEKGEKVYLSQWIGNDRIPINRVFESDENHLVEGRLPATISGPNDDIILTYLDSQFTKRIHPTFSNDYKFTAAIAQFLTKDFPQNAEHDVRSDRCIALRYPSVLVADGTHNTAMHAEFAKDRLKLVHVMELEIKDLTSSDVEVVITDTATKFGDGNLHWTGSGNFVPPLLKNQGGVPFVFNDGIWNLKLHEGDVSQQYIRALMRD